jgi:hypothetical protein
MRKARLTHKTTIIVTDAQVEAARMIVDHDKTTGRQTPEAIRKIADAAVPPSDTDFEAHQSSSVSRSQMPGHKPLDIADEPIEPGELAVMMKILDHLKISMEAKLAEEVSNDEAL